MNHDVFLLIAGGVKMERVDPENGTRVKASCGENGEQAGGLGSDAKCVFIGANVAL